MRAPQRPRDPNMLAAQIVRIAAGEAVDEDLPEETSPNPDRQKGGQVRAARLSPEQRTEIAKLGATARHKKAS